MTAKKSAAAGRAPAKRTPAKRTSAPSTSHGRVTAATKTVATKTAAKKTAAKKTPTKRSAATKTRTKAGPDRQTPPVARAKVGPAPTPPPPQFPRSWPNAPVRRGLGVALLGLAGAGRFTAGAGPVVGPGSPLPAEPVMDVALGAVDVALEVGERVAGGVRQYLNPLIARAWSGAAAPMSGPAGVGMRVLASVTEPLAVRGRRLRADAEHEAAAAVATVLPETIQMVMEQLDLTELAIDHVDIQRVLEATADQVDLTGFAIDHMDLVRLIEASLDQVDFTGLAITRLDFARAVTAAMEQVDVMTVAREQMDPARVAAYLRDNVDVAEALRAAPTAVAGEAVRGARQTLGRLTGRR